MKISIEIEFSKKLRERLQQKIASFRVKLTGFRVKLIGLIEKLTSLIDSVLDTLIKHKIKSYIILGIFIVLVFLINFKAAFLFSYFILFLFFGFDDRVPMVIGIVLLLICPILLIFKKEAVANGLAIWAYYFLVIGVVLQIAEYIKTPTSETAVEEVKPQIKEVTQPEVEYGQDVLGVKKHYERYLKRRKWIIITSVSLGIILLAVLGFTKRDRISKIFWGASQREEIVTEQQEEPEEFIEPEIDKAAISIQILNGNGQAGSALKMKDELEDKGFKVESTEEADNYNYTQTVIFYKLGKRDEAELVLNAITKNESVVLKQVISGQDQDIIIVVGADQLTEGEKAINRSTLRIMVQNGCGTEGAASRIKDKLSAAGYTYDNIDIGDADSADYANSIVYHRADYRKQADQIASDIGGTAIQISEDPSLGDRYDILVIVGLSEGSLP